MELQWELVQLVKPVPMLLFLCADRNHFRKASLLPRCSYSFDTNYPEVLVGPALKTRLECNLNQFNPITLGN